MVNDAHASTPGTRELARSFIEEVVNARQIEALDGLMHEDYVEHEPLPGQQAGRAGVAAWLREYFTAFPDVHWQLQEQIVENDRVASRIVASGTHQGDFLGVPATGHSMRFVVLLFQRMENGQIVEGYTYRDSLAALRQLGQISTPKD